MFARKRYTADPSHRCRRAALQDWRQLSVVLPVLLDELHRLSDSQQVQLLCGVATTVGGPPDVNQPGAHLFMTWAKALPIEGIGSFTLFNLVEKLQRIVSGLQQSNRVIIPTLQTMALVLEDAELLARISVMNDGHQSLLYSVVDIASISATTSRVSARRLAAARVSVKAWLKIAGMS